jgi:ceramide glucosyltransferase
VISHVLDAALLVWAGTVVGATGTAMVRAAVARRQRAPSGPASARDALLVRPCRGAEAALRSNLLSVAELQGAEGLAIVFAVPDASDAAWPVAVEAARELRAQGLDARAELTSTEGPNNKAAQLGVACSRAPDRPLIVVADSDVDLAGVDLASMLAPLRASSSVGATWVPPVEGVPVAAVPSTPPTVGDQLSAAVLSASLHAFPVLAGLDADGMVGKLFAVRREALRAVGGFAAFVSVLGEDVELARRIREAGFRVEVLPFVARARVHGRSVGAVVGRFGRWLTVVRAQRPALLASYPFLFSATLPITLLGVSLGLSTLTAAALVVTASARWAVGRFASHVAAVRAPSFGWMLAADVLLLCALVRALSTRTVEWRGRRLAIGAKGVLLALGVDAPQASAQGAVEAHRGLFASGLRVHAPQASAQGAVEAHRGLFASRLQRAGVTEAS